MKNKGNLISVIMSVFNEPEVWLRESIESILNQTFNNFEFIIINDNPDSDSNKLIINEYKEKDNRIEIINNEENIGLTKSLNKGIEFANGEYIVRMDADDIALPTRIEEQVKYMVKNPEVIVCGTDISYFGNENVRKVKWIKYTDRALKNRLFIDSCFAHPTVMIRKDVFENYNILYNEDFISAQDYKLWVDLANKGKFYTIPKVLLKYRISKNQISKEKSEQQKMNAYLARRQYFYHRINELNPELHFHLPVKISKDTFKQLKDFEKLSINKNVKKNEIRSTYTAMFNSLIYHVEKIDKSLIKTLFILGIIFRKGISYYELLRLLKRTYIK